MHVSCCATIVDHNKNFGHFLQVPSCFHIFAFFVLRVKVLVTNGPLDCLTSCWGLTSTCPVWRRITTEMLGDKKHVVVMKKPKGTITVYFKNTDVRKKTGWMYKREVLITGDGTIISTWPYEPSEGLAGCTGKQPIFLGLFWNQSHDRALGMKPTTSRSTD